MSSGDALATPCLRCAMAHSPRLACNDEDLSRRKRGLPPGGPAVVDPVLFAAARQAVIGRVRPTVNSFGLLGRIALTVPPYFLLIAMGGVMQMGTKVYVLTVGGPALFFAVWWTKHVWSAPRRH